MSQVLQLILRMKDEASASLKAFRKGELTDLAAASAGAALGVAGLAAEIEAVKATYLKIIKPAQDYILAVDELATKGQIAREDAAKWTALATLLDIPLSTIESAFKEMNDQGISPTIGNLENAADRFGAIEDPAGRAQEAVNTFGKQAGPEMTKLLVLGKPGIDALVTNLGLTIEPTEAATTAAKDLALAQAALDTTILQMTVSTGTALMPWAQQVIGMFLALLDPIKFLIWWVDQAKAKLEELFSISTTSIGVPGGGGGPPRPTPGGISVPDPSKFGLALGGDVEVGTGGDAYTVGEHGAERFTPKVPGTITPSRDQLASSIDRMVKTLPTILIDAIERAK